MSIESFSGRYRFLSNFYPSPVTYDNKLYPTVEHAYQAAKTVDTIVREHIRNLPTPAQAKQFAKKKITVRQSWGFEKQNIMRDLVIQKFRTHRDLLEKLLATGSEELIEGNTWGDQYWGECPVGEGKNNLGKILMEARDLAREQLTFTVRL